MNPVLSSYIFTITETQNLEDLETKTKIIYNLLGHKISAAEKNYLDQTVVTQKKIIEDKLLKKFANE